MGEADHSPYGSSLGHTIVIWKIKDNGDWHGASNHKKERYTHSQNLNRRDCFGTNFTFRGDTCISGIAVSFTEKPQLTTSSTEPSESTNDGLVIGLSVGGGVIGLSIIALIIRYRNKLFF